MTFSPDATAGSWTQTSEVRRVQRRTLKTLAMAQILGSIGLGSSFSVGILLAEQVTASETWAGVARTSSTVGAALAALPLAMLAVRGGRRVALALGWSLAILGSLFLIGAGLANSVVLLVLGMLLFGVGSAVGLQSRFAGTDLALPEHRARALSLVVWAGTVGSVLGPNLGAPGEWLAARLDIPPLTGAFVIAAVAMTATLVIILVGLRPDPALLAAKVSGVVPPAGSKGWHGIPAGARAIRASPASRRALACLVLAHAAMVLLMTMTPVHMHHHGQGVALVGFVISGHVIGMFAFSPVVGFVADRFSSRVSIAVGAGILLLAAAVAITAAETMGGISVSLFLLGLGWSFVMIPAAATVSNGARDDVRTLVQGTSDAVMNIVAALAAGLSGPLMARFGFGNLSWAVVVMALAILWLARGTSTPTATASLPPQVSSEA